MANLTSIGEPPINVLSQGAGAMKQILLDPIKQVWILNAVGAPGNGEGNGWAGPGSLAIDHTGCKLYMQTGTLAATVWTVFEASGGTVVFSAADALTAHSGGGKASALALAAQINRITVAAAEHDSVLLPAAVAGGFAVVINSGAHGVDAYGAGTDTINGVVTANPTFIPAGQMYVFYAPVAGKWFMMNQAAAAASQSVVAAPVAPASTTTYFMQGLAGSITPVKSGKVMFTISGTLTSSSVTAGDGILMQLSHGTGNAPANAGALAGTQDGSVQGYMNPTTVTAADVNVPFSMTAVVTGLALDTAVWLDVAAKSVLNASHIALTNVSISAIEVG